MYIHMWDIGMENDSKQQIKIQKTHFKNKQMGEYWFAFTQKYIKKLEEKNIEGSFNKAQPFPSGFTTKPFHNFRIFNDWFMELNLQQLDPNSLIKLLLCSNLWKSSFRPLPRRPVGLLLPTGCTTHGSGKVSVKGEPKVWPCSCAAR